jgi:uncharacterized protein (DUF1778 family)
VLFKFPTLDIRDQPLLCTGIYRTLVKAWVMSRATTTKAKGTKKGRARAYRFDARLNEEQKILIQRAADLEGRTMTDFVLHSAEAAAERTIQQRAMLILSARETELFVNAILAPAHPGPVLRAAVRHYKETMGR